MNQMVRTVFGLIFRVVFLLAGLVFLASMLTVALLVLAVWLLRALWARLTGQPVGPWTFQINRQAVWNRFYRAPGQGHSPQRDDADVIDAEIKEVIEIKEIKQPER